MAGRMAPTPSGYLHPGNCYNLLLNWCWARSRGVPLWLRIDDIDQERVRPAYLEDIFFTLDWLELDYDKGPGSVSGFNEQWSQLTRLPAYTAAYASLLQQQQLYPCTCSRKTAGEHCTCPQNIRVPPSSAANWRLLLPQDGLATITDAFTKTTVGVNLHQHPLLNVLWRKNGLPAYQLCSVTDDYVMGITQIARGADLLPSTALQHLLNSRLYPQHSWQVTHHGLLQSANGEKLSKSAGAQAQPLRALYTKRSLLRGFYTWMGWPFGDALPTEIRQHLPAYLPTN